MAKSLRSKWRRKMRAVKRERYGEKELKRLNEMLLKAGDIQFKPEIKEEKVEGEDAEMVEESKIPDSTPASPSITSDSLRHASYAKKRKSRIDTREGRVSNENEIDLTKNEEQMETGTKIRVFNKRTMRDQYGNYPDWMNKRKMRTQQTKNKRLKRKRAASIKRT